MSSISSVNLTVNDCAAAPMIHMCAVACKVGKHVSFGEVTVVNIDAVTGADRKPHDSHNLAYSHSYERQMLDTECEAHVAHLNALTWHEVICREYGLKCMLVRSLINDREHVKKIDDIVPVSVASAIYQPGVRRWLVDTGCPFDLIAKHELEDTEKAFIKKASKVIRLATPNGLVDANNIVSFNVDKLTEPIDAYIMESTPTVMSIGKRCMLHGYSFVWHPAKQPFLVTPKGKKVVLEVIDNVPYLPLSRSHPCAAATPFNPNELAEMATQEEIDESYEVLDSGKRDLKAEAKSIEHMMTHLPKNPHCSVCSRAKMENVKTHRRGGVDAHGFTEFGQHVTADTIVLRGVKDRGIGNKNNAIVFFDFGTKYLWCEPVNSRSHEDTLLAFRHFIGPTDSVRSFYSDGAPELVKCAIEMKWFNDSSNPGKPQDNSIAENKVKLVLNGSRCLLLQAGLPNKFWPFATQAFCHALNTSINNGESRYNLRHKNGHFNGKIIPFGCLVDYYPTKRTYLKPDSSKSGEAEDEDAEEVEDDSKDIHVEKH